MWRLPDGDRCLSEVEWELIAEGDREFYEALAADIDEGHDPIPEDGIYFENIPKPQQLAVVRDTLRALKDPQMPPPAHTAANEGALAAFCQYLHVSLETEFGFVEYGIDEDTTRVRRMIRNFALEHADLYDAPSLDCNDIAVWRRLIDDVDDILLWDWDYSADPNDSWDRDEENYFRSDSPVPSAAEVVAIRAELDALLYPGKP